MNKREGAIYIKMVRKRYIQLQHICAHVISLYVAIYEEAQVDIHERDESMKDDMREQKQSFKPKRVREARGRGREIRAATSFKEKSVMARAHIKV